MLPNNCRGFVWGHEKCGADNDDACTTHSVPLGNCSLLKSSKANSDQRKILNDL